MLIFSPWFVNSPNSNPSQQSLNYFPNYPKIAQIIKTPKDNQ